MLLDREHGNGLKGHCAASNCWCACFPHHLAETAFGLPETAAQARRDRSGARLWPLASVTLYRPNVLSGQKTINTATATWATRNRPRAVRTRALFMVVPPSSPATLSSARLQHGPRFSSLDVPPLPRPP